MRVDVGLVRVVGNAARAMLLEQADHRRAAGPAIEPDRQRRVGRVLAGLEEPEEGADRVVVAHAVLRLGQGIGRQCDIAGVAPDARCSLTDGGLMHIIQHKHREGAKSLIAPPCS